MLLASAVTKKDSLTFVNESQTLAKALEFLETSDKRCAPILDDTNQLFRGNIYKMHLYRHKSQGGDMTLPVTYLLKNATKFIYDNASPFNILFNLRDLPYIAVLNQNKTFIGVLMHEKVLDLYWQAFGMDSSHCLLTVETNGRQNDLASITKIATKLSSLTNLFALNALDNPGKQVVLMTFPTETDQQTIDKIVNRLEKKQFRIARLEKV